MESHSQMFGGAEECHSSESGWTMYLGSSINGDDQDYSYSDNDDDDGEVVENRKNYYQEEEEEEDSDDSMASDASSGPSTHQLGLAHLKLQQQKQILHDHDHEDGKFSDEKVEEEEKKNVGSRRRKIKDEKDKLGKFTARKSHNFDYENTGKKKHLDGKK